MVHMYIINRHQIIITITIDICFCPRIHCHEHRLLHSKLQNLSSYHFRFYSHMYECPCATALPHIWQTKYERRQVFFVDCHCRMPAMKVVDLRVSIDFLHHTRDYFSFNLWLDSGFISFNLTQHNYHFPFLVKNSCIGFRPIPPPSALAVASL